MMTCTKATNDGLPADLIYTYAVGYDSNGEAIEFGGDYPLCTGDQAFEIEGNDDCESRGYITAGFERVETEGRSGWVQEFVLDMDDLDPADEDDDDPASGDGGR